MHTHLPLPLLSPPSLPHPSLPHSLPFTLVYLSSDGSPESRQLFLTISSAARQAEREWDSGTPKISITVLPVSDSILEEGSKSSDGGPLGGEPGSLDSFDWTDLSSHEPSPFSGRRAMFSTQRADSVSHPALHYNAPCVTAYCVHVFTG